MQFLIKLENTYAINSRVMEGDGKFKLDRFDKDTIRNKVTELFRNKELFSVKKLKCCLSDSLQTTKLYWNLVSNLRKQQTVKSLLLNLGM